MQDRRNFSGVRRLGLDAEWQVLEALNGQGFKARHAEPEEDLSGWDIEIDLHGYSVWVDLTISRSRLRKKQIAEPVRNGLVIAVLVDPGWSAEELNREVLRQVIYSLPERIREGLLREVTASRH